MLQRKLLLALIVVSAAGSRCGEGLWPIQNVPGELLDKDLAFKPASDWIEHVRRTCVKVRRKDEMGNGSGAFVSDRGLVVTNRHCVEDALYAASSPTRNLPRDGFYAHKLAEELDCSMEILVVDQILDVTSIVLKQAGGTLTPDKLARYQRSVDVRNTPGMNLSLVPTFGGSHIDLFVYKVYDAKLVFVPDKGLGLFGGEDDNFCFPRHTLDIAFLRAYRNGAPLSTAHWFPISPAGAKDNDDVFAAGFPGHTERRLPVSRLEFLRDLDLPLKVSLLKNSIKALESFSQTGDKQRTAAAPEIKHDYNMMKIFKGSLDLVNNPEFMDSRKMLEKQWRESFADMKEKGVRYLEALDDIDAACRDLRTDADLSELCSGPNSRLFALAHSLNEFADAMRGKEDDQVKQAGKSFEKFLSRILDAEKPLNLNLEKASFVAWLDTAKAHLPADSALLKLALANGTPTEAAIRILGGAEPLTNHDDVVALLDKGAGAIDNAEIPLLPFMRELRKIALASGKFHDDAESRFKRSSEILQYGLGEISAGKIQPDATSTLRLGWGKISGYQEAGKKIPSITTFASMFALADAKGGKDPYSLSDKVKAVQGTLDLATPLNFVSTVDGAPGSSGSPVFTRDARLVGVMFDGNQQRISSMHAYLPEDGGGRSIAVHSAAIWIALDRIYNARELLEEIKSAQSPTED